MENVNLDDEENYLEIMLDIRDDSIVIQNIRRGNSETAFVERRSSFERCQSSQELKRIPLFKSLSKIDRNKFDTAIAQNRLQFLTRNNVGNEGWAQIERRFDQLAVFGILPKSQFGKCIGTCGT